MRKTRFLDKGRYFSVTFWKKATDSVTRVCKNKTKKKKTLSTDRKKGMICNAALQKKTNKQDNPHLKSRD